MLTLQKLKELRLNNRSNFIIYNLLSTIIGECEQISKNPTNDEILNILQKLYKDNNTTIQKCSTDRITLIETLKEENKFIKQYLPEQLSNNELSAIIVTQISQGEKLPTIMKYLSNNYKGRYNSKDAIKIISSYL